MNSNPLLLLSVYPFIHQIKPTFGFTNFISLPLFQPLFPNPGVRSPKIPQINNKIYFFLSSQFIFHPETFQVGRPYVSYLMTTFSTTGKCILIDLRDKILSNSLVDNYRSLTVGLNHCIITVVPLFF